MQCLVTAGPTFEPLDEVRRLTNFSTGTLGCGLAEVLTSVGHQVRLLLGEQASAIPPGPPCKVERFTTTQHLHKLLAGMAGNDIGAVFHAAAVSDFSFGQVYRRLPDGRLEEVRGAKIESRGGTLLAELVPTPKLLPLMREWFPRALIIGWKYEMEGTPSDALAKARRQLTEAGTAVCVLNGRAYGPGFALVTADSPPRHCRSRTALYAELLNYLVRHSPAQKS